MLAAACVLLTLFMYSSVMEVFCGLITYGWIKIYFCSSAGVSTSRTLKSCILFWLVLSMVALQVAGAGTSTTKTSTVLAGLSKFSGTGYRAWWAGLVTMMYTTDKAVHLLMTRGPRAVYLSDGTQCTTWEHLESDSDSDGESRYIKVGSSKKTKKPKKKKKKKKESKSGELDSDDEAESSSSSSDDDDDGCDYHFFNAVQGRVFTYLHYCVQNESLKSSIYTQFAEKQMLAGKEPRGVKTMRKLDLKYGQQESTRDTVNTSAVMGLKQKNNEKATQFFTRTMDLNAQLNAPFDFEKVRHFMLRGLNMSRPEGDKMRDKFVGWIADACDEETFEANLTAFENALNLAPDSEMDAHDARFKGKRPGGGRGGGRKRCFFCEGYHIAPRCFCLIASLRPDSWTPEQHRAADNKRAERMAKLSAADREKFETMAANAAPGGTTAGADNVQFLDTNMAQFADDGGEYSDDSGPSDPGEQVGPTQWCAVLNEHTAGVYQYSTANEMSNIRRNTRDVSGLSRIVECGPGPSGEQFARQMVATHVTQTVPQSSPRPVPMQSPLPQTPTGTSRDTPIPAPVPEVVITKEVVNLVSPDASPRGELLAAGPAAGVDLSWMCLLLWLRSAVVNVVTSTVLCAYTGGSFLVQVLMLPILACLGFGVKRTVQIVLSAAGMVVCLGVLLQAAGVTATEITVNASAFQMSHQSYACVQAQGTLPAGTALQPILQEGEVVGYSYQLDGKQVNGASDTMIPLGSAAAAMVAVTGSAYDVTTCDSQSEQIDVMDTSTFDENTLGLDSCAAGGVSPDRSIFQSFDRGRCNIRIRSANGIVTRAAATGTVHMRFKTSNGGYEIVAKRFVYAPGVCRTLISVGQLLYEHNLDVVFRKAGSFISTPNGGRVPVYFGDSWDKRTAYLRRSDVSFVRRASPVTVPAHVAEFEQNTKGTSVADVSTWRMWHSRLCGPSPDTLSRVAEVAVGCNCPTVVPKGYENTRWDQTAVSANLVSAPFHSVGKRATRFRERVSCDFIVLINTPSHAWHRNCLNFLDEFSNKGYVYPCRKRSDASGIVMQWLNETEPYCDGMTHIECRSDNEKTLIAGVFKQRADLSNMLLVTTAPYSHQQNPCERFNRTVENVTRYALQLSKVPLKYWDYAIKHANHVIDVLPSKVTTGYVTRYQLMTGRPPDMRRVRTFGCLVKVLKPERYRTHKFDARSWECVCLGWDGAGWTCLKLDDGRLFTSRELVFYENVFPFARRQEAATQASQTKMYGPPPTDDQVASLFTTDEDGSDGTHVPVDEQAFPDVAADISLPAAGGHDEVAASHAVSRGLWTPEERARGRADRAGQATPRPGVTFAAGVQATPATGGTESSASGPAPFTPGGTTTVDAAYEPFQAGADSWYDRHPEATVHPCAVPDGADVAWYDPSKWCNSLGCRKPAEHDGPCGDLDESHRGGISELKVSARTRQGRQGRMLDTMSVLFTATTGMLATAGLPFGEALSVCAPVLDHHGHGRVAPMSEFQIENSSDLFAYATCIDAMSASFPQVGDNLEIPLFDMDMGDQTGKTPTFDFGAAMPTDIPQAKLHPNWNTPRGFKWAIETEWGRWKKMGALSKETYSRRDIQEQHGQTPISSRVLLSVKTGADGSFDRCKCRIIVHGNMAEDTINYFDRFASCVKWVSNRTLISTSVVARFKIHQLIDVSTAFLYFEVEPGSVTFIQPAKGFEVGYCNEGHPLCHKAVKCCYGLPSAPGVFHRGMSKVIVDKCKAKRSKTDPNCYVVRQGKSVLMVGVHVDDLACHATDQQIYDRFLATMRGCFECNDQHMTSLLGTNVKFCENGDCYLTMEKFINKLSKTFGAPPRAFATPASASMASDEWNAEPVVGSAEWKALQVRAKRNRSLVPSMLYACTACRPEISYAVGRLCSHVANPSEMHLAAADQLFGYLANTSQYGIRYTAEGAQAFDSLWSPLKKNGVPLKDYEVSRAQSDQACLGFSDASWLVEKSITGMCNMIGKGCVSWSSHSQKVTSLSSTEAEYYAASSAAQEILFVRHLLQDMGYGPPGATTLGVDNSACVDLSRHFESFKRARHIDRRINFLTDYTESQDVTLRYVPTEFNPADLFTKPFTSKTKFNKFREYIGVFPSA